MPLPDAAVAYDRAASSLSATTVLAARRLWRQLGFGDFDEAWRTIGPQFVSLLTASQVAVGRAAAAYVPAVVDELGLPGDADGAASPTGLAGVASDGRTLDGLLYQPIVATRTALGQGVGLQDSLQVGRSVMDRIVTTQVADAGRAVQSVELTARPRISGYVRALKLPSCSRCAILAGAHYRWNAGFKRHPGCDCYGIPSSENIAGDLTTDPRRAIEAGQVHGLSQADTQAIKDGADPGRVINAQRGMSTTVLDGRKLKTTTTGFHGRAKRSKAVRLRPEGIYQLAGNDRAEAVRLLKAHGYLV
jgi:hypothetical protein